MQKKAILCSDISYVLKRNKTKENKKVKQNLKLKNNSNTWKLMLKIDAIDV